MESGRVIATLLAGVVAVGCESARPDVANQPVVTLKLSDDRSLVDAVPVAEQRRATHEQLLDPAVDLREFDGVDLGSASPPPILTFCEAVAEVPSRWLNDAIFPLQFWVDSFWHVDDAPPDAADAIVSLLAYGHARIHYHLGRAQRPAFTPELASAAKTIADAAVAECPDLPAVLGRSADHLADPWYGRVDEATAADRCAEDRARIEEAIASYQELYDDVPKHLEQVETGLLVHDEFFLGSDLHGIALENGGQPTPVPVEGGPCARLD